MPEAKASLLIVDDEPAIRNSLAPILTEVGYRVRSAHDGFSALAEIRKEVPEILISDLNMPGMSGTALLSVVRRRFPAIQVIAMSGAFSGHEVPSGVAADAFFEKSSSIGALLKILESLPRPERMNSKPPPVPAPFWIARNGYNSAGEAYVTIECPDCLRTFPQVLNGTTSSPCETDCVFCGGSIRYIITRPADQASLTPPLQRQSSTKRARRTARKLVMKSTC
jgi:CheY-like chemotaxis protein